MSILGITNRTENWMTAAYFAPLSRTGILHLAKRLGESSGTVPGDVHLELFWRGIRDYLSKVGQSARDSEQDFASRYNRLFGPRGERADLRTNIGGFRHSGGLVFSDLRPDNYSASTEDQIRELVSNLVNTEIDVVLESPTTLFVGEAKHESGLGGDGSLVLVHQLIRQYVAATVLVDMIGNNKQVVPFVIWNRNTDQRKPVQLEFMIDQGWMRSENVLEWNGIEALCS